MSEVVVQGNSIANKQVHMNFLMLKKQVFFVLGIVITFRFIVLAPAVDQGMNLIVALAHKIAENVGTRGAATNLWTSTETCPLHWLIATSRHDAL